MKTIYWLALIPFLWLLGGVSFANKVQPYLFGLPFILAYIVLGVIASAAIMGLIYKLDPENQGGKSK